MSIQYQITTQALTAQAFDCLLIPVLSTTQPLSQTRQLLDQLSQQQVSRLINNNLPSESGELLMLHEPKGILNKRILCIYYDEQAAYAIGYFQKLMAKVVSFIRGKPIASLGCYLEDFPASIGAMEDKIRIVVQAFEAGLYSFNRHQSAAKNLSQLQTIDFCFHTLTKNTYTSFDNAIKIGLGIAKGMTLAKDLVNEPSNICTPTHIASVAKSLMAESSALEVESFDISHAFIQEMGAFRAVAQGSAEPAQFVVMHYNPPQPLQVSPIALVGKGVTFDAGGISLKPARHLDEMKCDMAGAASVLGTMRAIAQLKCQVPVVGILPLTENLPSGTAMKPGDVLKTLSGRTVEVIDTDAEGRLILADALTYSLRFNPAVIIDVATLTGAIVVALGNIASGLMSTHDELSAAIIKAGEMSGDRVWRLPCWKEYQALNESKIADIANLGSGGAGSITAACFLESFTEGKTWAHLDIAGTAFDKKRATGRCVPLLTQYIINYCSKLKHTS